MDACRDAVFGANPDPTAKPGVGWLHATNSSLTAGRIGCRLSSFRIPDHRAGAGLRPAHSLPRKRVCCGVRWQLCEHYQRQRRSKNSAWGSDDEQADSQDVDQNKTGSTFLNNALVHCTGMWRAARHIPRDGPARLRGPFRPNPLASGTQVGPPARCAFVGGAYKGFCNVLRYCMASARWLTWVASEPAKSAMVRATFRARWVLRADQPNRAAATFKN